MQSAIFYVLVSLQVLEKLAVYREKGRTEAICTTRRIKGIIDNVALILKQATTFINLDIALLVAISCKNTVAFIIRKVSVNDDVGDFLKTAIARRLRRRGAIGRY